ncbi:hypothetical protein D3C72_1379890 [compost metagenome]
MVRAGHVAELDELVAHRARVAVGDEQVALLRADRQLGAQRRRLDAVGEHDLRRGAAAAVGQAQRAVVFDGLDLRVLDLHRRRVLREQPARRVRRIEDAVARHFERARQAGAQGRLGAREFGRAQQPALDAERAQPLLLAFGLGHFFVVRRDPERAAGAVGAVGAQARREGAPLRDRMAAEFELGRVVVHHHEVAHARAGGTAQARVEHAHAAPGLRQRMGTRRADDAGADDDDVRVHAPRCQRRMPQPKGSSSSMSNVASALMCARPRSVGMTWSPSIA